MNRIRFLVFYSLLVIFFGPIGCSWFHDDSDERFWEETAKTNEGKGASTAEINAMKAKVEKVSKLINDAEAKVSILEDGASDVGSKIKQEKEYLQNVQKLLNQQQPGGGSPAEEANELRRQIRILENDVEWLKWIQKNF
ncbi:MAG: hypothetical protein HZA01_10345 [Nitrospinae bacterium]|nr:hypothetical protein [Nitrospinota bacterium]